MAQTGSSKKNTILIAGVIVAAGLGWYGWSQLQDDGPGAGFASGNGRIEATEIDIATKLAGRIVEIHAQEGDFVTAGQPLVAMQIDVLNAQHEEAEASHKESLQGVAAAQAQVALSESEVATARAVVAQREAERDAARSRLGRSETLSKEGAASLQELDDDRAQTLSAEAAVLAARAQVASAQSAVLAASAQEDGAVARVAAAQATIKRIAADITDSQLTSPRDGRVQLRVAEPGEVLAAGGRVLNLIDVADVYLTFFLPETVAGRVALGSDVRLILDAAPHLVLPAKVTFVASTAQFTPKTVETASERQKLMFRVKAQIDPELLLRHLEQVKTGLPGVAWIKTDADAQWPASLAVRVPE
ncbi:HlyD family secretion protein [Pseudomonas helleri]|uniref:HlyD family efflux transporter periplasmic adaptor subunit n=3 Tax=Pseudomonas TaxID=286 RepID=A0A6L5HST1_9PSED|nr:HlyD family efflux transporter periplasmic adaptor subunit [Pseudomonas helleri]MQT47889.1 HlyD family efflux transporter periplasmic adaptor subunit [Pseudomonas helleri]MQT88742.1 HlyD family efflux transporter periplasmic adaptor subunit [Pseudomonas helleri]MQU06444.1 HlyD family efflux transporter periplasmic adaptor subunit [Pseudomonas helleri]